MVLWSRAWRAKPSEIRSWSLPGWRISHGILLCVQLSPFLSHLGFLGLACQRQWSQEELGQGPAVALEEACQVCKATAARLPGWGNIPAQEEEATLALEGHQSDSLLQGAAQLRVWPCNTASRLCRRQVVGQGKRGHSGSNTQNPGLLHREQLCGPWEWVTHQGAHTTGRSQVTTEESKNISRFLFYLEVILISFR